MAAVGQPWLSPAPRFPGFPGWPDGQRHPVSDLHDKLTEAACHVLPPPPRPPMVIQVSFVDAPSALALTIAPRPCRPSTPHTGPALLSLTRHPDGFTTWGFGKAEEGQPLGGMGLSRLAFAQAVHQTLQAVRRAMPAGAHQLPRPSAALQRLDMLLRKHKNTR